MIDGKTDCGNQEAVGFHLKEKGKKRCRRLVYILFLRLHHENIFLVILPPSKTTLNLIIPRSDSIRASCMTQFALNPIKLT